MENSTVIYVNARFLTQPLTGVQRYAFECCMQMKREYPALIFLSPPNIIHEQWAKELHVTEIGSHRGHMWEQWDLYRYLCKKEQYILFNPCNTAPLGLRNNVITIHDLAFVFCKENFSWWFTGWYNFLIPRIAANALHLFAVSETMKQQLYETYSLPTEKITVTYNGIASNFLEALEDKRPFKKEKIIMTVGSLSKRKNIDVLMKAFIQSSLRDEYILIIVGAKHAVFEEIELPENKRAILLHDLSDKQLMQYYRRAEIFVSLSSYEGFGIPVLEALAFGCKVLCSDIETYHELFEDYVYFCDHADSDQIIKALKEIATHTAPPSTESILKKYSFISNAAIILQILLKSKNQ